jgi:hypothetical protein
LQQLKGDEKMFDVLKWLQNLVCPEESGLRDKVDALTKQNNSLLVDVSSSNVKLTDCTAARQALIAENEALKSQINLVEAVSFGTITLNDAWNLLQSITSQVYLSDDYFQLTSVAEASKFSRATKVRYRQWIAEDHDCDNFSFALMGYWSDELKSFAFGIAWSDNHAFNIMIDSNKKIWIIEPQTNEFLTLAQAQARTTPNGLHYLPIRFIVM